MTEVLAIMGIPLTQGLYALVDGEDYKWLSRYKWFAAKIGNTHYAYRRQGEKHISMHRVIMKPPPNMQIDHANHDGLDNRKLNMRICTNQQNAQNQRKAIGFKKSSKHKGVCWSKNKRKWQASIEANQKKPFLGYFDLEIEAAAAYNNAAKRYFGEYAELNILGEFDG